MPGLPDLGQPQRRAGAGSLRATSRSSIREGADLAIDGGDLPGLPSTVVDIAAIEDDGSWRILRDGALSPGDLASKLASVGLG